MNDQNEEWKTFDLEVSFQGYNEADGTFVAHCETGPAIVIGETKRWFYNGKLMDCNTQEMFDRLVRMKAFW